jgi:hypothetical protein
VRSSNRVLVLFAFLLQAAPAGGALLLAQEPDTTRVPERRPEVSADSLQAPDSLSAAQDTLAPDTAVVKRFPGFPDPASRRPGLVANWELGDLLSTGALSFADLIEFTPFLDPVRAGFLDGPQASVFAGSGPGSFRYDIDGYEIAPLLGGGLDLHMIPLVELQQARMVREPGGYRAIGHAYRRDRRDPYSRIEGGTGDKGTNLLRGFFSTRLFGAPFGFGLDRVDTRGEFAAADRTFVWADLALPLPADIWGEVEHRSTTVGRDSFPNVNRTDWIVRLRREFSGGWYADVVGGSGKVEEEPLLGEGTASDSVPKIDAQQVAVRAAKAADNWQAFVSLRAWNGEGVPEFTPEASFEIDLGPASFYAIGNYTDWGEFSTAGGYASLTIDLPLSIRALAEIEEGDRGIYNRVPKPRYEYGRWTAGAEIALLEDYRLGGRAGQWRVERSLGLGPPVDSIVLPGGTAGVLELWGSGPISRLFGGVFEVGARYRVREEGPYLYWPKWDLRVEGEYRLLTLNDQLQVWLKGIGGIRGPMFVPDESLGPGAARGSENLNTLRFEAVVRIKDMHIFYNYEYFDALGNPNDLLGYQLPSQRYHLGLKWEFWN